MRRQRRSSLAFLLCAGLLSAGASSAQAAELEPCTTAGTLERADDPAPSEVTLPFPVKFYGKQYTTVWVTNHGKVAFRDFAANPAEEPVGQGFGAYTFSHNTESVVGPFLADLDTTNGGSVSWGTTTFEGRPAFCVDWEDVRPFKEAFSPSTAENTFQMLLVKRGTGGDFDMVFNYDKLEWATYDVGPDPLVTDDPLTVPNEQYVATKAVAGYSAGPHHQATGDFVTLRGGDEDTGTLLGDSNVGVDGRFVFSGCNATLCPEPVVTPTPTVPRPNPTPVPQVTAPASSGSRCRRSRTPSRPPSATPASCASAARPRCSCR